jgi:glycyl-tRNA synthetase beta chain
MKAMRQLSQSENFSDMRATFKRVMGLTKEHTSTAITGVVWVHPTEEALAEQFSTVHAEVQLFVEAQQFSEALSCLSTLKEPIDALFDAVMVMDEDLTIRSNRLSLLKTIADAFRQFADFTILST